MNLWVSTRSGRLEGTCIFFQPQFGTRTNCVLPNYACGDCGESRLNMLFDRPAVIWSPRIYAARWLASFYMVQIKGLHFSLCLRWMFLFQQLGYGQDSMTSKLQRRRPRKLSSKTSAVLRKNASTCGQTTSSTRGFSLVDCCPLKSITL